MGEVVRQGVETDRETETHALILNIRNKVIQRWFLGE